MKDAFRIKYLNPLARIEEELEQKIQGQLELKKIKYKMKSINAFALNQTSFYPDLPSEKNEDSGSTLTSPKEPYNSSIQQVINPENELQSGQKKSFHELSNNQQCAMEQQVVNKSLDQSIIIKLREQFFQEQYRQQYCLDCDSTYEEGMQHYCLYTFSSMKSVENRFEELLKLMTASKSEKFIFLAQYSHQLQDSNKIIAILQLLRGTGKSQMSSFQQILRKRLINICTKKLAFVLQRQEED